MTSQQFGQLAATLVATCTPLLVVSVARLVAGHHAALVKEPFTVPRKSMQSLIWATLIVSVVTLVMVWRFEPLSLWPAVVDLTAFALLSVLGLRVLRDLETASRPSRMIQSTAREASLSPRRLTDYVSLPLRLVPFVTTAVGVVAFAVRAALPAGPRQLFVPVVFAGGAIVFLWLYEVWIRQLVSGPVIVGSELDDEARRRSIRRVVTMETILTATSLAVANFLLNLDWRTDEGTGTAVLFIGALIGIVGCALALASGLGRRAYANASR